MSDEIIRKGDLVMVVKPLECCNSLEKIGKIFTVEKVDVFHTKCRRCKGIDNASVRALYGNGKFAVLLSRLKKINPPATDTAKQRERELIA